MLTVKRFAIYISSEAFKVWILACRSIVNSGRDNLLLEIKIFSTKDLVEKFSRLSLISLNLSPFLFLIPSELFL